MIFSITGPRDALEKIEYPEGMTFQKIQLELSLLAHQRTNEMPVWRKKVLDAIACTERSILIFLCPDASSEELTDLTRSIQAISYGEAQALFVKEPAFFERCDQVNAIYSPETLMKYITLFSS